MTDEALAALQLALAEIYSGADLDDARAVGDHLDDLDFAITSKRQA